jgi:hypothetical protein
VVLVSDLFIIIMGSKLVRTTQRVSSCFSEYVHRLRQPGEIGRQIVHRSSLFTEYQSSDSTRVASKREHGRRGRRAGVPVTSSLSVADSNPAPMVPLTGLLPIATVSLALNTRS